MKNEIDILVKVEKILIYKFPFYSRSEKILIFFIILYMII